MPPASPWESDRVERARALDLILATTGHDGDALLCALTTRGVVTLAEHVMSLREEGPTRRRKAWEEWDAAVFLLSSG
jgi:hypothetical protein